MPSRRQTRENIRQYRQAVRQKDTLMLQKKSLAEDIRNNTLLCVFFFAVICVIGLVGTLAKQPSAFLGVIPMAALAILFACFAFRGASAYRKMRQIRTSAVEEQRICVQKIRLWMIPGHRGTSWIRCVVLIDENKEKFYYVYPAGYTPISGFAEVIRSRCMDRSLCVSCYQNTRFISYIDFSDNERSPL